MAGRSITNRSELLRKWLRELKQLSPFDPDHMPEEILLTEAFHRRFPDLPQVACFDTAFHHDLPRVAQILPIPRRYEAQGVRRYGFHGLSYEFLMEELARLAGPDVAQGRVILAHLGNGASLAAVRNGKSVDTSMSFTPTAGVPMSTRTGDLDPGLVWYLARTEKMSAKKFNDMVNFQSGLLGISETSSDMRDLLKHETQDVRAAEAVALFCYQVKKWIGAFAAALGGIETLVFAGGIGENAPAVRARICDGLGFLGIELEEKQNAANEGVISAASSRVAVRVIRTNEEQIIAKTVCQGSRPCYNPIFITNYGCNCRSRIIEFAHEAGPRPHPRPDSRALKQIVVFKKTGPMQCPMCPPIQFETRWPSSGRPSHGCSKHRLCFRSCFTNTSRPRLLRACWSSTQHWPIFRRVAPRLP